MLYHWPCVGRKRSKRCCVDALERKKSDVMPPRCSCCCQTRWDSTEPRSNHPEKSRGVLITEVEGPRLLSRETHNRMFYELPCSASSPCPCQEVVVYEYSIKNESFTHERLRHVRITVVSRVSELVLRITSAYHPCRRILPYATEPDGLLREKFCGMPSWLLIVGQTQIPTDSHVSATDYSMNKYIIMA